jgi:hypothetical protein
MDQLRNITETLSEAPTPEHQVDALEVDPSVNTGVFKGCTKCLTDNPHDLNHCRACGCLLVGHTVTPIIHGGRRRRQLADPERTELFQTWAADLGGIDALTAGQRVLLRRAAEADLVCRTAFHYLADTQQSWTSRRAQTALVTLAQHSNTIFRVAALLGISRQHTPMNPLDAVRQAVREANK